MSAGKCRFVFGSEKFHANKYQRVSLGGEPSGGILVVRLEHRFQVSASSAMDEPAFNCLESGSMKTGSTTEDHRAFG